MWRAVVLSSLAGCYHPSPVAGIPCSDGLHCPGDQVCDTSQEPPTCVDHLGDAGADAVDAADGDDALDAISPLGCTRDTDCTGGVCHEMTGECIPDAEVLFVVAGANDNGQCTRTQPCASLSNAFSRVTTTRHTIAVADGTYSSGITNFHVPGAGMPVLISGSHAGWDGAVLKMSIIVDGPLVTMEGVTILSSSQSGVENRSTTTLSRVLVSNASEDCIDNRGDEMTVLDSKLDGCTQLGLVSTAVLDLERTIISNNKNGGLAVMAPATIVNNMIVKNGGLVPGTAGGVLLAGPSGSVAFRFNTVVQNNTISSSVAPGVTCAAVTPIADSIIANNGPSLGTQISDTCHATYCLFDTNAPAGTGNLEAAPMFANAPGDLHLQAGSPAIDKADPAATDAVDFEGGHRPTGLARDIGADETP